jgi:hypothetical protein
MFEKGISFSDTEYLNFLKTEYQISDRTSYLLNLKAFLQRNDFITVKNAIQKAKSSNLILPCSMIASFFQKSNQMEFCLFFLDQDSDIERLC